MRLTFCFSRNWSPYPTIFALRSRPCCPGGVFLFSTAQEGLKQRSPFRNNFIPSLRQSLHTGPEYLANVQSPKNNHTRLRFGGRQPLCGIGVTSRIARTSMPAVCSARIAESRPEPGPFTLTSSDRMPASRARLAAVTAACCAAKGVPFREPLKPSEPALDQHTTLPSRSVIVTVVLLNDA